MTFVIEANLDCEARWSGLALSRAVLERISLYGLLLSALAPDGEDIEVWTPAAIDPARWLGRSITCRVGTPARADLRWAQASAKAANDRRLAQQVATELGVGLRGARVVTELGGDWSGAWVAKVPWTAAGRDRVRGDGEPSTEQRTRLGRLLAACDALVVEPWCERLFDLGVCATVDHAGRLTAEEPHSLLVDARGGFVGIDLAPPPLTPYERAVLDRAVIAAGAAIAKTGHTGPFAVDAFVYRDGSERRLHPLCEINARYSFGWVARAFAGITRLGFGAASPGTTVVIAPGSDQVTAWIA